MQKLEVHCKAGYSLQELQQKQSQGNHEIGCQLDVRGSLKRKYAREIHLSHHLIHQHVVSAVLVICASPTEDLGPG
jgi:hypothetical protein